MVVEIDDYDRQIMKKLESDGRIPFSQIAEELGISNTMVHKRVQKLLRRKVIKKINPTYNEQRLGYGYGAFWTPERVQEFAYIHNWAFSNAHSIFLETAIDIGLLGLFLFVTTFSLVLHRAYAHWVARRDYGALFVISAIVAAATHGLVEAIHVSVGLAFLLGLTAVVILSFQPLEPRCD